MSNDPLMVCLGCHTANNISDLVEIEEEKEHHSHFECPECDGEKFAKHPPRETHQEQANLPDPPEPPKNHDRVEPRHQSMDARREQKRQSKIRSLENRR